MTAPRPDADALAAHLARVADYADGDYDDEGERVEMDDTPHCGHCAGSGEGVADGTRCTLCGGTGEAK